MNPESIKELEKRMEDAPYTLSYPDLKRLHQYHDEQARLWGNIFRVAAGILLLTGVALLVCVGGDL